MVIVGLPKNNTRCVIVRVGERERERKKGVEEDVRVFLLTSYFTQEASLQVYMLLKKEGKIMFVENPVLFSKVRRERDR